MPIFMDLHIVPGVTAEHVAEAHQEDLKIQDDYGCRVMTYWVDEDHGSAFCLMEAPNKEAVIKMHENAHGLIPHEIIEVNSSVVEAFLGRIKYPKNLKTSLDTGLKIFNDPAFRIILVITTKNTNLLQFDLGLNKFNEVLGTFTKLIKQQIVNNQGRLVEMEGEGYVISFVSVSDALNCATTIQKSTQDVSEILQLCMSLNAGLPVDTSDQLFGITIKFAHYLCDIGSTNQIVVSSIVEQLNKPDYQNFIEKENIRRVSTTEEKTIEVIMKTLEGNWQDPEFGVADFCAKMSISKSKLYRQCTKLTKMSPNELLRKYRLKKSLAVLKTGLNISETAFESGFSSPSYFAKCFQKQYGILPMQYLKI